MESLDEATTRLYQSVCESPRHAPFIATVQRLLREPQVGSAPADLKLVIVPAAFYRQAPRSGADGRVARMQAERLGWQVDTIPLASDGSMAGNAQMIVDWLRAERSGSRVVLVSLSKGRSDLKMALTLPGAERAFERVVCWLNLSGILSGTPLSEWLLSWQLEAAFSRLYYSMRGASVEFVRDLRREAGAPLDFELALPSHVRMISVAGFPQRRHMTSGVGRRCYDRVSPHGPNDGVIVLEDVCALPGVLYPIWGADHLMRSGTDMDELMNALLRYIAVN